MTLLVALTVGLLFAIGIFQMLRRNVIRSVIGLMILHCFVPFPAEIIALAAGMVYGPAEGTVVTWIGAMIGAALSFGIARWLGRPAVAIFVPERHRERLDDWTRNQGVATLLVARLIPVIAFNLVNYAAGLTNMRWRTYICVTGIGILPLTVLMVWMGSHMRNLETWHWALLFAAAVGLWLGFRVRQALRPAPEGE